MVNIFYMSLSNVIICFLNFFNQLQSSSWHLTDIFILFQFQLLFLEGISLSRLSNCISMCISLKVSMWISLRLFFWKTFLTMMLMAFWPSSSSWKGGNCQMLAIIEEQPKCKQNSLSLSLPLYLHLSLSSLFFTFLSKWVNVGHYWRGTQMQAKF